MTIQSLVSRHLNHSVWQSGDSACVVRRDSNETEELPRLIKSQIYTKTDLASHIQTVWHFLCLSCKSVPGGTLLWQVRTKDNVSMGHVPLWIKQENIPYRDDNKNVEVALIYRDSFYWHLWRSETRYFCYLSRRLKSKGSQTVKSRRRNVYTIKKIKTNLEDQMWCFYKQYSLTESEKKPGLAFRRTYYQWGLCWRKTKCLPTRFLRHQKTHEIKPFPTAEGRISN